MNNISAELRNIGHEFVEAYGKSSDPERLLHALSQLTTMASFVLMELKHEERDGIMDQMKRMLIDFCNDPKRKAEYEACFEENQP